MSAREKPPVGGSKMWSSFEMKIYPIKQSMKMVRSIMATR